MNLGHTLQSQPNAKLFQAELARRNFLDFTTFTKPDYKVNWHHEVLANDYLQLFAEGKIKKLMVFMPPQHGKSELTSRRLPAYMLGLRPKLKIAGCSYGSDVSTGFNRDVQRIIDDEDYKLVFPNTCLNSKNVKSNNKGSYLRNSDVFEIIEHRGSYKSVGVGGALTSYTVDILIIDDPVKDAVEAQSPTDQQRKWEWYVSVALTRLHNDSQQLITMTRWDKNDLCGKILQNMPDDWVILHLEALKQNISHPKDHRLQGEALWEERHSKKKILSIAKADPRTFNALYQGDPKPNKTTQYITAFNYGSNVRKVGKKALPLHYTVDFNTSPYMTGIVIQMEWVEDGYWNGHKDYWEITVIDSFALASPHNDSKSLAKFFESGYPEISEIGHFQYGDASGNNNTGISSDNDTIKTKTLFSDLISGFSVGAKMLVQQRIPKQNPKYRSIGAGMLGRRVFVNKVIQGIEFPTRVIIDPKCKELIEDMELCTADANGKLAKPKDKHGVEKNGHNMQAFEYFVCHPETLGYLAKIK
jgi:hypothetical protein